MYTYLRKLMESLKLELEANIPYQRSEIIDLVKPSMMGESAINFIFDTEDNGIGILFWDSGVFEISTDIVQQENGDNIFFYNSHKEYSEKYSKNSVFLFQKKIEDLLRLLHIKYPKISLYLSSR